MALEPGTKLDEIIVSASRRPQKIQEAPASVSVVSAKDIENSAIAVDPVRHLVNVPGVQIQQQSANTINIEMRAGSGVFGTSTLPILDYRYLSTSQQEHSSPNIQVFPILTLLRLKLSVEQLLRLWPWCNLRSCTLYVQESNRLPWYNR